MEKGDKTLNDLIKERLKENKPFSDEDLFSLLY